MGNAGGDQAEYGGRMSGSIINDYGRWEIMSCLHILADDARHASFKGLGEIDWALGELLDCWVVFDVPEAVSGYTIYPDEVAAFKEAGRLVLQLVADLGGNAPDEVYVGDPRWREVVRRARSILEGMFERPPDGERARREFALPPRSES